MLRSFFLKLSFLMAPLVVISYGVPKMAMLSDLRPGDSTVNLHLSGRGSRARNGSDQLSPVVLVPGTGGNQLEARLTSSYKPGAFWCYSFSSSYFRLWLDVFSLVPPFTACFAERMKLEFNPETERFQNSPGIETRVPHFGTTEGLEYLDPTFKSLASYMGPLVTALKDKGYEIGKNLFGAPYDFRYAPGPYASEAAVQFGEDLIRLIEKAYHDNDKKPVVLVSHSLGGLWTLYMINQQPLSWRTTYLKSFVAVSTPWGGAVQEMLTFASGYTEGISLLNPLTLRAEQRSSESNLWLLPVPEVFGSQPLVLTPTRMYTANDIEDFLEDIGYPEGVAAYKTRIPPLISNLTAPGVPVSILCGYGVETPERLLYYEAEGFDRQPTVMNGDGDGTVNYKSLLAVVNDWEKVEGQQLRVIPIPNKSHVGILSAKDSVEAIVQEALYDWDQKSSPEEARS